MAAQMDKMTCGGKATDKCCDFIGLFFTKRTNFIFDLFLTNDYTKCANQEVVISKGYFPLQGK